MFFDFTVKIPHIKGKIFHKKYKNFHYIHYQYDTSYNKEKKYAEPKRTTIGKACEDDPTLMYPNANYYKFFPAEELPSDESYNRSGCLKVGTHIVIDKLMKDCGLKKMIQNSISDKYDLFLDLVAYSIISENNAAQYYPDYAYNHPLFTENMKIYSDATVGDFLRSLTEDNKITFLNQWNAVRPSKEKVYISYDSTNKKCQAGDIDLVETGHSKSGNTDTIFNYSVAYDVQNKEPLLYEEYPGSITDISQLQCMIEKIKSFGYKHAGFILDRGYFSKENIHYMDKNGYDFIIMMKAMKKTVKEVKKKKKGQFESSYSNRIITYGVSGTTVEQPLFPSDSKNRYIHVYYNDYKAAAERAELENKIEDLKDTLNKHIGEKVSYGKEVEHYFDLVYWHKGEEDQTLTCVVPKTAVIDEEVSLCGYFTIVTSEKMSAKEALLLYKSRDVSEKLFRGDKSYLGNSANRVHSNESFKGKILVEFVALILRNKIYTCLSDEMERTEKKRNYMTVPAAIRELEKIEMIRYGNDTYRLDHAITKTQKTILKSFDIDSTYIKTKIEELSLRLGFKDIH